MINATFSPLAGDFESLSRQYWNAWNELLGRSGQGGWSSDPLGLMAGMPPGLGRMDPMAFDWLARIQQLAGRHGQGGTAADIARSWRELLGGEAANPFAGMMHTATGGMSGAAWLDQVRPLLEMLQRPLRQQGVDWMHLPAFGPAREHQERLQALALAWKEWEQHNEAFNAVLLQAGGEAFKRFEQLLEERDAPGKRLESARALFDLWIEAAEDAWAEVALSPRYREAYAAMTNALMRVRVGLQREVEQFGTLLGLPGRSEVDALHRKVAGLERALHAARRGGTQAGVDAPAQRSAWSVPASARPAGRSANAPAADATGAASTAKVQAPSPAKRKAAPASAAAGTQPQPGRRPVRRKPAAKSATPAAGKAAAGKAEPAGKGRAVRQAAKKPGASPARRAARPAAARTPKTAVKTAAVPPKQAAKAKPKPKPKPASTAKPAGAAKPAPRKPAGGRAKGATQAPGPQARAAQPAPGRVVSMKDWVSRNLAVGAGDDAPAPARGRKGGRT